MNQQCSFFRLPPELLIQILRILGTPDLARCLPVCRELQDLIKSSLILQYSFRLSASGLVDVSDIARISTAERLQQLEDLNKSWRNLEARRVDHVALRHNQIARFPSTYQIGGGYMVVRTLANRISVFRLASSGSAEPTSNELYDFTDLAEIGCIVIDPAQDLLVVGGMEQERSEIVGSDFTLVWHLRRLSDPNVQHPLASIPQIRFPNPFAPYGTIDECVQHLHIRGTVVAAHIPYSADYGLEAIVMFDWKSGFMHSWATPRPPHLIRLSRLHGINADTFHLLSHNLLLFLCVEDYPSDPGMVSEAQPTIELFSYIFDPNVADRPLKKIAEFRLPTLASDIQNYRWINHTSQASLATTFNTELSSADTLTPDSTRGVLAFSVVGGRSDDDVPGGFSTLSCDIIIPAKFFTQWLKERPHLVGGSEMPPVGVEWDGWGPQNTRIIDHVRSTSLASWYFRQSASGSRFVQIKGDNVRVLDFNPYEIGMEEEGGVRFGPPESFTASGVLFGKVLRTTLPYVERSFPVAKLGESLTHLVMIDHSRIIAVLGVNRLTTLAVYAF